MDITALQTKEKYKSIITPLNVLKLTGVFVLLFIIFNIYSNTYEQQVLKLRKNKDHHFRTSINSPIIKKEKFEGLTYFKPDPKYKVMAAIEPLKEQTEVDMMSSDGRKLNYIKFAIASFMMNEKNYQLILLKNSNTPGDKILFLPFSDKTSGEETYMAGRYLDVLYDGNDKVLIDFNQAYHPYCVYNYKFSCPIPPSENYLDFPVLAGEKLLDTLAH